MEGIALIILVAVGILIFFWPLIVALGRKGGIWVILVWLFFGWTIIMWIVCLIWAYTLPKR